MRGEIEDPEAGVLIALVNLARNEFIAAFSRSFEGSISLRDVASDGQCLSGEPPAGAQPAEGPSRRERRRNRC